MLIYSSILLFFNSSRVVFAQSQLNNYNIYLLKGAANKSNTASYWVQLTTVL